MTDIGAEMLMAREGVRLAPYNDSQGYCTTGVGHLIAKRRCTAEDRAKWTLSSRQAALDLFRQDLAASYEPAVDSAVTVPLADHQFDALVSFTFNVGVGGFRGSTLLRRLNAGDYEGAATAFMMWNKPKEIIGRRQSEQQQFRTPYGPQAPIATSGRGPSVLFGNAEWLHPVFRERLEAVYRLVPFTNRSGGRSTQRQAELYRDFKAGRGNPANPPGTSWHEYWPDGSVLAQAADIHPKAPHTYAQLHAAGRKHGIHFPVASEAWHAQPVEAKSSKRTAAQGLGPIAAQKEDEEDDVKEMLVWSAPDRNQVLEFVTAGQRWFLKIETGEDSAATIAAYVAAGFHKTDAADLTEQEWDSRFKKVE